MKKEKTEGRASKDTEFEIDELKEELDDVAGGGAECGGCDSCGSACSTCEEQAHAI